MRRLALAALLACIWTTPGIANDKFATMDKDTNDSISWEEFQTQYPNMKKAAFDTIDKDASSAISKDEWSAFMGSHGSGGKGMGEGMGEGMGMPPKDGKMMMPPKDGKMMMPPKNGKMMMPPKDGKMGMPPAQPEAGSEKILIEPPKKSE